MLLLLLFVVAVFVEVFGTALQYNQQGELRCKVKAPTNATITVQHNGDTITTPFRPGEFFRNCDGVPQISTSAERLDDKFSLFSVVVHVS